MIGGINGLGGRSTGCGSAMCVAFRNHDGNVYGVGGFGRMGFGSLPCCCAQG